MSATNPADYFGGTWQSFGAGRTLISVNSGDADFNAANKTGGEKKHTLTVTEMPKHSHDSGAIWEGGSASGNKNTISGYPTPNKAGEYGFVTNTTGGDGAHNNLPPYITVYMWKRTA